MSPGYFYDDPRNGYSPKTVDFPTNTKTLKLGAITKGKFIESEIKYIDEIIPNDSYLWLKSGDILIQRSNSIDYVGVSAIYNGDDNNFIYPDLMMKVKTVIGISEKYIHFALSSKCVREYYRCNASGAQKSMPKINQKTVSSTLLPIPPPSEQKAIVAKVEKLFAYCEELEKQISKSQRESDQLMQSILKEAFG
ncbi:MAG: restriction endonuclease subunit S [Victivallales bacterium]